MNSALLIYYMAALNELNFHVKFALFTSSVALKLLLLIKYLDPPKTEIRYKALNTWIKGLAVALCILVPLSILIPNDEAMKRIYAEISNPCANNQNCSPLDNNFTRGGH